MQQQLMDILICPMCKGDLELKVEKEQDGEIVTGTIICKACRERYPIEDGIPNMLPPDQRN
ncbi:MAG TPA: methytransferase partner Trm112 [Tepidiformaceae bacterium]|nr:methytransferase partner Trm112 [Tepidiformaceae bacterium]